MKSNQENVGQRSSYPKNFIPLSTAETLSYQRQWLQDRTQSQDRPKRRRKRISGEDEKAVKNVEIQPDSFDHEMEEPMLTPSGFPEKISPENTAVLENH